MIDHRNKGDVLFFQIRLFLIVALVFSITACGGYKPFRKPYAEEHSLVFGYLDMKEAPSDLRFITAKRIKPKSETPYFGFFIKDGLFYRTYLPEGLYRFKEFGGFSWRLGAIDVTYQLPSQGKQPWDPVIKVPGIYFIGSYKYVKKDRSFLDISYDLTPIKNPSEKELLQRLLKIAVHPTWKKKIEKRIKEIKS